MVKRVLRICRLVSTKYANVTDTADGQTDTGRRHRPHLRRASRGKIKQLLKYSWDATWNIPHPEITRRESLKTGTNPYSWPYPIRGLSSGGGISPGATISANPVTQCVSYWPRQWLVQVLACEIVYYWRRCVTCQCDWPFLEFRCSNATPLIITKCEPATSAYW